MQGIVLRAPTPQEILMSKPRIGETRGRAPARLLKPDEVCGLLRVSKKSLYRLVRRRELPVVRIRNRLRFLPADVITYVRQMRDAAGLEESSHVGDSQEEQVVGRHLSAKRTTRPASIAGSDQSRGTGVRSDASWGGRLIDIDAVLNRGADAES